MRITISGDLIRRAEENEGAFAEARRVEMHAALVDSWVDFLSWARSVSRDSVREEARQRTGEGQIPPWGDVEDD